MTIDLLHQGFRVDEVPCALRHRPSGTDFRGQMHRAAQYRDVLLAVNARRGSSSRWTEAFGDGSSEDCDAGLRATSAGSSDCGEPGCAGLPPASRHGTATAIPVAGTMIPESLIRNADAEHDPDRRGDTGRAAGRRRRGRPAARAREAARGLGVSAQDQRGELYPAGDREHEVAPQRQHPKVHSVPCARRRPTGRRRCTVAKKRPRWVRSAGGRSQSSHANRRPRRRRRPAASSSSAASSDPAPGHGEAEHGERRGSARAGRRSRCPGPAPRRPPSRPRRSRRRRRRPARRRPRSTSEWATAVAKRSAPPRPVRTPGCSCRRNAPPSAGARPSGSR